MKDKTSTPKYISLLITYIPAHTPKIPMRAYFPANCQVKRCRKILFPFNGYANYLVRAVTACHSLRSRAGLQGFRSEIGYQNFDQVWNRVRVSRSVPHTPSQFFWKYPWNFWDTKGRSLCQAFLAETVETGTKNRCVIEATHVMRRSLGKIKFRAFPKRIGPRMLSLESVHYFAASEQYWVVLWANKSCDEHAIYFGDWNDVLCKSLFRYLAMM